LSECRKASLVIAQQVVREDGTLLVDAEVRVAALRASSFKPVAIPEAMYAELQTLASKPPSD